MNQQILMSIRPQHACNILNGDKTIELRTHFPKDYMGWVYLYCTKGKPYLVKNFGLYKVLSEKPTSKPMTNDFIEGCILNGKVVCRFWVDNVEEIVLEYILENEQFEVVFENHTTKETEDKLKSMCLTFDEFLDYHLKSLTHKKDCFVMSKAIHISKLEIFDEPKELWQFKREIGRDDEVIAYKNITTAPQSYMYVEVEDDNYNQ